MEIINNLVDLFFEDIKYELIEDIETFSELTMSIKSNDIAIPTVDRFETIINSFPANDFINITISMDSMGETFNKGIDFGNFIKNIKTNYDIKDDDSEFKFNIRINKKNNDLNGLTIYKLEKMVEYLKNQTLKGILYSFNEILGDKDYVVFDLLDSQESFNTSSFYFMEHSKLDQVIFDNIDRIEIKSRRDYISNFLQVSNYNFIPEDFYLMKECSKFPELNNIMNIICGILSLGSISNISNIISENDIYFKMDGYKVVNGKVSFNDIQVADGIGQYFKIYKWVYKDGNISDKVGLARNIISLYIDGDDFLKLNKDTINSINSSYEIYLKENVQQYIETKNKVTEFLFDISQKSSEIVENFGNTLKNNLYALVTFFISVIILNSLSGADMLDIFTRDIVIISYSFLGISFLFLLVSILEVNSEMERFKNYNSNLRTSYSDILDPKDIERIFNLNKSFEFDIEYITSKTTIYSILWFIVLLILYIIINVLK